MPYDKEKMKEYNKEYHQKNKDKKARRKEAIREFVESMKGPCVICGIDDKDVIDFHHIDPEGKEINVSRMVSMVLSIEKIKGEISKCVCLCANDHRRFHKGKVKLPVSLSG